MEKELSAEDKNRLAAALAKKQRKAEKAIRENRCSEAKPSGSEVVPEFNRVSKGRKKLWARQYMQHKKTGVIVKVEIKNEE